MSVALPGMGSSMNEPDNKDTTSAPVLNPVAQNVAQVLNQRKKKPGVKSPSTLAAAIARSRKARQTGDKWGA